MIFINPGFTIDTSFIDLSSFSRLFANISANSKGGFLFIFDKTIATFVEMSQLNFSGGISVFIPSKLSGKIILPFFDKSKIIFFILSKY